MHENDFFMFFSVNVSSIGALNTLAISFLLTKKSFFAKESTVMAEEYFVLNGPYRTLSRGWNT